MVHIYHLYDNKLQVPVYVGATTDVKVRFAAHLNTTLKEYANKDFVSLEVLETSEKDIAGDVERFWFNKYKNEGFSLLQSKCKRYPATAITILPKEIIGALADAFDKSYITIQRWVKSGDNILTSEKAKKVFDARGFEYKQDFKTEPAEAV